MFGNLDVWLGFGSWLLLLKLGKLISTLKVLINLALLLESAYQLGFAFGSAYQLGLAQKKKH